DLSEYQFHVFVDFREFHDDVEGGWKRLCTELGGRGVENLEDELKQMRYGTLNEAFKVLICRGLLYTPGLGEHQFPPAAENDNSSTLVQAVRDFFIEMRLVDDQVNVHQIDEQLKTIQSRFKRLSALLKAKPVSKVAKTFRARITALFGSEDNSRLIVAWLLMSGMKSGALEQFGFDCTLRRMMEMDGARQRITLLNALLSIPEAFAQSAHVFSASACRKFLNVHESRGIEWFNKERFEELAEWLAIRGIIDAGMLPKPSSTISAAMVEAENTLNQSCELAASAGYRTALYRRLLPTESDPILVGRDEHSADN
ncbi:MAG: hypothetical protein PHD54_08010, partial [Desulfuromonadaceae bacterium]|nr:hypothetical protein [Desulfuromonadaceae bacterium]